MDPKNGATSTEKSGPSKLKIATIVVAAGLTVGFLKDGFIGGQDPMIAEVTEANEIQALKREFLYSAEAEKYRELCNVENTAKDGVLDRNGAASCVIDHVKEEKKNESLTYRMTNAVSDKETLELASLIAIIAAAALLAGKGMQMRDRSKSGAYEKGDWLVDKVKETLKKDDKDNSPKP